MYMVNMIMFNTLSFHCHICIYKLQYNWYTGVACSSLTYGKRLLGRKLQIKWFYRSILIVNIPAEIDIFSFQLLCFHLLFSQTRYSLKWAQMRKRIRKKIRLWEHEMKKLFTLENIDEFRFKALSFIISICN